VTPERECGVQESQAQAYPEPVHARFYGFAERFLTDERGRPDADGHRVDSNAALPSRNPGRRTPRDGQLVVSEGGAMDLAELREIENLLVAAWNPTTWTLWSPATPTTGCRRH
jgi:hypothetical protein